IAAGLLTGKLQGGRFAHLVSAGFRGESVMACALGAQVVFPGLGRALGLSDAVVVVVWCLLATALVLLSVANSSMPWMRVVTLGLVANVLVVAANTGMPVGTGVSPSSTEFAMALQESPIHVPVTERTKLVWLADLVPVPGPRGVRGRASIGDVALAVGVAGIVSQMMRGPVHDGSHEVS
ncbi:MAG: DUF5317 family protein, partial [Coriobacteriia bacterium]|nr:DUF5317 family protein [Coriobacteriia bacterium]